MVFCAIDENRGKQMGCDRAKTLAAIAPKSISITQSNQSTDRSLGKKRYQVLPGTALEARISGMSCGYYTQNPVSAIAACDRMQMPGLPLSESGELLTSTHRCKGTSINMNPPGFEFADYPTLDPTCQGGTFSL